MTNDHRLKLLPPPFSSLFITCNHFIINKLYPIKTIHKSLTVLCKLTAADIVQKKTLDTRKPLHRIYQRNKDNAMLVKRNVLISEL